MVNAAFHRHPILLLSRLTLGIEHAARVLWAPASLIMIFIALAAFDLLPMLPPWLHAAIVLCFAIAIAGSLRRGLLAHAQPSHADALRRLERDSGIQNRPFDALHDTPVSGDDLSLALWQMHQARSRSLLRRLSLRTPNAALAAHDTQAWRALAVLLLVLGLISGWGHLGDRLDAALSPRILGSTPARDITLDIWITPPAFTGLSPIVLSRAKPGSESEIIEIPEGSKLEARVGGGSARPHLLANGKRLKFAALDHHDFEISSLIQSGTDIAVTQGLRTLGHWRLSIVDTAKPVIAWAKPPAAGDHDRVKLDYTAADQYGLAKLTAKIELASELRATMLPRGTALDKPDMAFFTIDLPDLAGHPKSIRNTTQEDWTANPWAGFPVHITLSATGVAGLSGSTDPADLILPEHKFTNPAARLIIDQRKRLTLDPLGTRIDAATKLAALAERHDLFGDDIVTFLVLRTAAARLWADATLSDFPDIQNMLWQVAIRLEDGGKSAASRAFADAAEALKQALQQGAPQNEIDRLSTALKQAMNNYLNQLQHELEQKLAHGEAVPMAPPSGATTMDRNDLENMIDKMRQLSKNGDRTAAEDMLSQMEDMMRDLRMAETMGPNSKAMQAWNAMRTLHGLAEKQQQLNDRTYQSAQGRQNQSGDEGKQQQDLKDRLEDTEKQLQGLGARIPDSLKQSGQSMGHAEQQLDQQDYAGALPHQHDALNELRKGLQDLQEQMGKGATGLMLGGGEDGNKPGGDPFGRTPGPGAGDDQRVHVQADDRQRSREVLEELRKRSGDRFRSRSEHDYIDRLLQDY